MENVKEYLVQTLQDLLDSKETVPEDGNLLAFGLNSIRLIRLIGMLKKNQIEVSLREMIEEPTLEAWTRLCESRQRNEAAEEGKEAGPAEKAEEGVPDNMPEGRFPMTPMQKAYLWGRQEDQPLGGVSCHAYVEYDPPRKLDTGILKNAWIKLLKKHPALRTRFHSDGTQEILTKPYSECFQIYELDGFLPSDQERELLRIREQLSGELLDVYSGEVIRLSVSLIGGKAVRLHLSLDLLAADVISFKIILDDLTDLYQNNDSAEEISDWSFSRYLADQQMRRKINGREDREFWEKKVLSMRPGSSLLTVRRPETITGAAYRRRQFQLSEAEYQGLKKQAAAHGLTVSMILLTLYAQILARWSGTEELLINIPLFSRDVSDPGVETAVADFTAITLLDISLDSEHDLFEQAAVIQHTFHENYSHDSFDGIEVQKLLAGRSDQTVTAPVVFSCTEGVEQFSAKSTEFFGKPVFILTQTPQVYIDFQVFQIGGSLNLSWDVPEELFCPDMVDEMFNALEQKVRAVCEPGQETRMIASDSREVSRPVKDPGEKTCLLHSGFYEQVQQQPDAPAMIDTETGEVYSYGRLSGLVSYMAGKLLENGVSEGDTVAVTVERGPKEIISILAVLSTGACYVPMTPNQPAERRRLAMETMGIRCILSDQSEEKLFEYNASQVRSIAFAYGSAPAELPELFQSDEAPAYIILTSGTTGTPKGVQISHAAAWNTIQDVNRRIDLNRRDVVLAVSSIDFDLSVYDIFGTLSAGGTLCVLGSEHYRDAEFWLQTAEQYRVSVWNSVPVLFDMLLTEAELKNQPLPFRAVLLSGDWIASSLFERLRNRSSSCRFIGMGGATEASIWSNWYEVTSREDLRGDFVPYGWPLENQQYRIVDGKLRDCPRWAPGELLIGGKGLAAGYEGDPDKTAEKFIRKDGQRWYRTGDLGYYQSDDCIIFLGRMDHQCKVRGHRIEVEEIEKHLRQYFRTEHVICWPAGPEGRYTHLEACVYQREEEISAEQEREASVWLSQYLPGYMIPARIYSGGEVPLNANGKVDRSRAKNVLRRSVKQPADDSREAGTGDEDRRRLEVLWLENLDLEQVASGDNYYFSGGDSLKAIKLCARINETFGCTLRAAEILEAQTFAGMLTLIQRR